MQEEVKAFKVKLLPESEVELSGDIPFESLAPYRNQALTDLAARLDMPGFRKGHVPTDIAAKQFGEIPILEEACELYLKEFYPLLVTHHTIEAVGRPEIRIIKLAPGNPVSVIIKTAVYPKVELPKQWQKLAADVPVSESAPATEEEIAQTLKSLQESRKQKTPEGTETLPELDDAFAQSLGAFTTLDALKAEIARGITEEKQRAARDSRRGAILDRLVEQAHVTVPRIFVESEIDKIMAQMNEDLARMQLSLPVYLTHVKKTEAELRNDFKAQAEKRAKVQLILNAIAEAEHITADPEAVEREVQIAKEHFPKANEELVRIHVETVLRNDRVLQLLESDTKKE